MVVKAMCSFEEFQPDHVLCPGDYVGEAGPSTQGGRDSKVRNEKERAHHGKQTSLRTCGRINAAPVGKIGRR